MEEFIYPTRANKGDEWARDMFTSWIRSGLSYLSFPWLRWKPHTLVQEPFWMYLYYSVRESDITHLQGKIEFRVHVRDWQLIRFPHSDTIYRARNDEDGKAWFLCDRFEEIQNSQGELLTLADFSHAQGKNLVSTLRNSIPPVICGAQVRTIRRYP